MISDNQTIMVGIAVLAVGTYIFRLAGPFIGKHFDFSSKSKSLLSESSAVLLFAVAIAATLFEGDAYAGNARVIGILVAGFLAYRKMPFLVIVLSAAAVTSLLRLMGIH